MTALAFYTDDNKWKAASILFDSMGDLAGTNFGPNPPDYVTVAMPDGRPQGFKRVADYPVGVVERLANNSFDATDFWGTIPVGALMVGDGSLVYSSGTAINITQLGIKATVPGGTYEFRTVVSDYVSGTLTPYLMTPVFLPGTAITASGTRVSRVTTSTDPVNGALTGFRLAGASFQGTVTSASVKRVMTNACIVSVDGLIWSPVGNINVLTYGVIADGVTNDTAALLNSIGIAWNLGRKALLPRGRMLVTGPVLDFLGTGLVQIEGDPASTVIVNEMTAAGTMFTVTGRTDANALNSYYLTAHAAVGDMTLHINDTTNFKTGQNIIIKDWSQPVEYYYNQFPGDAARTGSMSGEVSRIRSISGTTQLNLASRLEFPVNQHNVPITGTVSTLNNTVTGVGTSFTTELRAHQYISIDTILAGGKPQNLKIRSVTNDTHLELDVNVITVSGKTALKLGGVVQRFIDQPEFDVSGVRVVAGSLTPPNTNVIFKVDGVRRYTGRDLTFLAPGCYEFLITRSLQGRLLNYHSEDAGTYDIDAYCIIVQSAVRGLEITNAYAIRPRHLVTTGGAEEDIESAHVYHTNCHVDQPIAAAFDQHPSGRNFAYVNCGAVGADLDPAGSVYGMGFQLRGRNTTVANCHATSMGYGMNIAFGKHIHVNGFLTRGCDISLRIGQGEHIDVKNLTSLNAQTNDVYIDCNTLVAPTVPLLDIRVQGRGEGNPSGASVTAIQWGDDWRLDFRNPNAVLKYDTLIPSSHSHGIISKTADFTVTPNLTCVYRCTGTVNATLPFLFADTGEATYTFVEVSGALVLFRAGGGDTINGANTFAVVGMARVKKNGETGEWVTW